MVDDITVGVRPIALGIMCTPSRVGGLTPPLSADEAAMLAQCFVADVCNTVMQLPAELGGSATILIPDAEAAPSSGTFLSLNVPTLPQRGDRSGLRCFHAIEDLLAGGAAAACLISADCPTLPGSLIEAAVAALHQPDQRLVVCPAVDGGCCLIGLQGVQPELLLDLSWDPPHALADLEKRARELGLGIERLPSWYHVADGVSLTWLMRELQGELPAHRSAGLPGAPAPRTRAYLEVLSGRGDGVPLRIAPPILV